MNVTDEAIGSGKLVDVEVRVLRLHENRYPVEITVTGGGEQQRLEFSGSLESSIANWVPSSDLHADGAALYEALLKDGVLRDAWGQARGKSENRRVRLRIDPEAAELNVLPWELIREGNDPLSAMASTPFSRYLPVRLPWIGPEDEYPVRILVVISNPTNLDAFKLGKVEVDVERSVLEQALAEMGSSVQVDFMTENVTLETLEARLRRGKGYHVLHFIGHGNYNKDRAQAMLFFQDDTGCVRLVSDDALVGMLARLPARPMLVFLVACQSAVVDTKVAFSGLAPRLVEVGVPAVIAMQDIVSVNTARKLESTFYQRLAEHRQVDLALNEARATLLTAGRLDAGTPVLYMRLRSGTLWGKGSDSNARGALLGAASEVPQVFWNNLCQFIRQNNVVPVLGPRANAQWLPTPWKVAEQWADTNQYPFKSRDEISRVAQYLQISGLYEDLGGLYIDTLTQSFREGLPPEYRKGKDHLSLSELVEKSAWGERLKGYPNEINRVLAGFDTLDLYLTTNPDNLMFEALKAAGRNPRRDYCRWNNDLGPDDEMWKSEYAPSPEEPLVYHLLGSDIDPLSVVLTEDNYFRYMASLSERMRIPPVVWAISTRPLMFIGYSLYDWEFRVLLHQIVARKDPRKSRGRNIAVQLEFKEAAGVNESTVRSFLEKYLSTNKISVYWGSTEQFIAELREEMEKGPQA